METPRAAQLAERMGPLFERGRAAYRRHLEWTIAPGEEMPFGADSISVVRLIDFCAHARLCHDYVVAHHSIMILADDGTISSLLCRHSGR